MLYILLSKLLDIFLIVTNQERIHALKKRSWNENRKPRAAQTRITLAIFQDNSHEKRTHRRTLSKI
jgi:hypothetical protein